MSTAKQIAPTSRSAPVVLLSIIGALLVVVVGTWATVRVATDRMIYEHATNDAREWADLLVENVNDLAQIAAGEPPSLESMNFFDWALRVGATVRYEIFNGQGYTQLVAETDVALVDIATRSADAVRAIETGRPVVAAATNESGTSPRLFSRAFVPVFADGRPIAVISAVIDDTTTLAIFERTFGIAAIALSLIAAAGFGFPAAAWYRRSKQKRLADDRVRFLAHHDALTGLANRPTLVGRLESALKTEASAAQVAVHFLDVDRFKDVNDSLGHDAGDYLLESIAQRLVMATNPDDVVARMGGDEFVVIQHGASTAGEAGDFARRLVAAVGTPILFYEREIAATASVGVSMAPSDGTNAERLIKCADIAMYSAKSAGGGQVRLFRPEMDDERRRGLELEQLVRDATANEKFHIHYQPIVETPGYRLVGFEALLRMPDANGNLIPPDVFIPVAEQLRLIDKVGAWVLRQACLAASTWPADLKVAVNLSVAQFTSGDITATVAAALREANLNADRLELEITEGLLLNDDDQAYADLRALKSLGVSIVMDDFGTGYSSLGYLWRFPFDKIKVDKSFMNALQTPLKAELTAHRGANKIVSTILALARELRLQVTVEGVERADQLEFLDRVGASLIQGFLFSRPLPSADVPTYILTHFGKSITAGDRRTSGEVAAPSQAA